MTWYGAHVIQYARFLDGVQDSYPCYENIVLIEAESADRAREEADKIGHSDYGPNYGGTFSVEGRPAEWVFAGIRKLVDCDNMNVDMSSSHDPEFRPDHGTEITYVQLEVDGEDALRKLVNGEPVVVRYDG